MPARVVAARAGHADPSRSLAQFQDFVEAGLQALLLAGQAGAVLHRLLELLLQQIRILVAVSVQRPQQSLLLFGNLALVEPQKTSLALISSGRSPGATAKHEQVRQRVAAQSVRSVQSGRHLAGRVKAG